MEKIAYFHNITDGDFKKMLKAGTTWYGVMESFKQPKWCGYPDALSGVMGCWSLTSRLIKREKDCMNCELHRDT